jgi:hypothetical protein
MDCKSSNRRGPNRGTVVFWSARACRSQRRFRWSQPAQPKPGHPQPANHTFPTLAGLESGTIFIFKALEVYPPQVQSSPNLVHWTDTGSRDIVIATNTPVQIFRAIQTAPCGGACGGSPEMAVLQTTSNIGIPMPLLTTRDWFEGGTGFAFPLLLALFSTRGLPRQARPLNWKIHSLERALEYANL